MATGGLRAAGGGRQVAGGKWQMAASLRPEASKAAVAPIWAVAGALLDCKRSRVSAPANG